MRSPAWPLGRRLLALVATVNAVGLLVGLGVTTLMQGDAAAAALGALVAFCLALLMAGWLQRGITAPVAALLDDVERRMPDAARADAQPMDEWSRLGRGFTHLRVRIESSELKLAALRHEFDRAVDRRCAELRAAKDETEAARQATSPPNPAPVRVLLAEDNPVNAELAVELLAEAGCCVTLAMNGAEAVSRVMQQRFDLVLMDCLMPVMDGFEATRRIRAHEAERSQALPRTPVIALTAGSVDAPDDDRARCAAAGMDDHLGKPFQPALLRAMVERWTRRERSPADAAAAGPASSAADAGCAVLDREALLTSFRIGGRVRHATARKVIALFLDETPRLLKAMSAALDRGDAGELERIAHTIRSSSAAVGAMALSQQARAVEGRIGSGDLQPMPACLRELERQHELAARALAAACEDFPAEAVAPAAVKA